MKPCLRRLSISAIRLFISSPHHRNKNSNIHSDVNYVRRKLQKVDVYILLYPTRYLHT